MYNSYYPIGKKWNGLLYPPPPIQSESTLIKTYLILFKICYKLCNKEAIKQNVVCKHISICMTYV